MLTNVLRAVFSAAVISGVLAAPASLGDTYNVKRLSGAKLTEKEIIESLEQPEMKIRTRGLKIVDDDVAPAKLKAIAVPIRFEFASSALTGSAKRTLDVVGKALASSALSDQTILVEGHTDSVGSDEYNLRLSESRAAAVKKYLVETTGVEQSRLRTVGRGEAVPLEKAVPQSAENRRVQFVNVTGQ